MFKQRLFRTAGVAGVVLIGIAAVVAGQSARVAPSTTTASLDDLLAEVRELRAEIHQAAGASIRTQLLVARLQLQEQRLNAVFRRRAPPITISCGGRVHCGVNLSRGRKWRQRNGLARGTDDGGWYVLTCPSPKTNNVAGCDVTFTAKDSVICNTASGLHRISWLKKCVCSAQQKQM